jgi:hypothetical protein
VSSFVGRDATWFRKLFKETGDTKYLLLAEATEAWSKPKCKACGGTGRVIGKTVRLQLHEEVSRRRWQPSAARISNWGFNVQTKPQRGVQTSECSNI